MHVEGLQCWRCAAPLDDVPQPFARAAECSQCHADLHVCRLCQFFDPSARRGCREPVADEVNDKDRSNFCGYFQPTARAPVAGISAATEQAKSGLADLFGLDGADGGGSPTSGDAARDELDRLFGLDDASKPQ